jgi:hypothetical protein
MIVATEESLCMQFCARLLKRSEPNHEGSCMECRHLVPIVADVAMKKHLHVRLNTNQERIEGLREKRDRLTQRAET